ncbi:Sodium/hydrogen exchanger 8, partial [Dinochytrium kinnereticum]
MGANTTLVQNATQAISDLAHATSAGDHESSTHALFIRALLMLSLMLVSMNVNGVLHKKGFHYLSESAVMILLGVLVAMGWTAMSYDEANKDIQLSANFFYMVLLPPIIFEGGFTLQRITFFANFVTIFSLAFAGALASTFICSILMFLFSKAVLPWSLAESLVFGSIISSTDPVTVLSLLPSSVDKRLYMLIFGESALNDAVSIILFRFFTEIADPKMKLGVGPFFLSVFASAGVLLAFMCECFIFLYLGLGLLSFGGKTTYNPLMIIFAVISILVARCHVFIIIGLKNWIVRDRDEPIPMNQQVLIWFSGLRGAVAFALGVSFLEIKVFDEDIKGMIFGTTVVVIVISVIVFGGLTPYMLVWLGLVDPRAEDGHGHGHEVVEVGEEEDELEKGGKELKVEVGEGEKKKGGKGREEDPFRAEEDAMEEQQQIEVQRKMVFGWLYHFDS